MIFYKSNLLSYIIIVVQNSNITPSYVRGPYQKIEYAYNNGSGTYVDTGINAKANTTIEIKFNITSRTSSKEQRAIAKRDNNMHFRCGFESDGSFQSKYGFTCSPSLALNTVVVGNGAVANITDGYNTVSNYNMYMFAQNESGTVKHNGTGNIRIYYCKIKEGTTIVRELRAAKRKSDSVVGFLDVANKVFYTPSGGSLVAGPDVN